LKNLFCCLAAVVLFLAVTGTAFADVKLPEPAKSGGEEIFTLLERRASGTRGEFPSGAVSDEELAAILWAGTGLNRGGKGWTVPLAGGKPPYVKVFAVRADGVFLYDWKNHSLVSVSDKNALAEISGDGFVRSSSCVLIFVSDPSGLGNMARLNDGDALAYIATGAMTQNMYLAADTLGISTRYMVSMKTDAVKKELKLKNDETPLCIMPLGKR
jgi:hypothetical protein